MTKDDGDHTDLFLAPPTEERAPTAKPGPDESVETMRRLRHPFTPVPADPDSEPPAAANGSKRRA
jgi:hypothetical protein